jgi:hypothetical protein
MQENYCRNVVASYLRRYFIHNSNIKRIKGLKVRYLRDMQTPSRAVALKTIYIFPIQCIDIFHMILTTDSYQNYL